MTEKKFILASASPRRKQLLSDAGYVFEICVSNADETLPDGIDAAEAVKILAEKKAEYVSKKNPGAVVLGCDTVVALDGKILGKPNSSEQARQMLMTLSGRSHTVFSGVCVTDGSRTESFVSAARVEFYELEDETVSSYIATGEPFDKAGAYGIQGLGAVLVKKLDGDYFTVMGLPLAESARLLCEFEIFGTVLQRGSKQRQ